MYSNTSSRFTMIKNEVMRHDEVFACFISSTKDCSLTIGLTFLCVYVGWRIFSVKKCIWCVTGFVWEHLLQSLLTIIGKTHTSSLLKVFTIYLMHFGTNLFTSISFLVLSCVITCSAWAVTLLHSLYIWSNLVSVLFCFN